MTYSTVMAHLEVGHANHAVLKIALDLAERFHAHIIGIAAYQPMQLVYGDGYVAGEVIQQISAEIEAEAMQAEIEFRSAVGDRFANPEWRSVMTMSPLADYIAREARGTDLLVTGLDQNVSMFDTSRHVNLSDLVLQTGRPVLIVPNAATAMNLDRVMIGWKDRPEARRAILDALPLLHHAGDVLLVEIAAADEHEHAHKRLADVQSWLARHTIKSRTLVAPSTGHDSARLDAIAREQNADVIVAGAYGHSRLSEWVLGGVTRDLLLKAGRCTLVSH